MTIRGTRRAALGIAAAVCVATVIGLPTAAFAAGEAGAADLARTGGGSLLPWIIGGIVVLVLGVALVVAAQLRKRNRGPGGEAGGIE